ncbi:cytochrome P450 4V2 [Nephila pilipes]|uniref:Cytochrome P450 4V2 n=1 Tax=Nephila pilipes TaxID=299642 RepID=A0A8X6UCA7_NEPPI|nr:cytochrome P450 4V2 [Nephila pilipes]
MGSIPQLSPFASASTGPSGFGILCSLSELWSFEQHGDTNGRLGSLSVLVSGGLLFQASHPLGHHGSLTPQVWSQPLRSISFQCIAPKYVDCWVLACFRVSFDRHLSFSSSTLCGAALCGMGRALGGLVAGLCISSAGVASSGVLADQGSSSQEGPGAMRSGYFPWLVWVKAGQALPLGCWCCLMILSWPQRLAAMSPPDASCVCPISRPSILLFSLYYMTEMGWAGHVNGCMAWIREILQTHVGLEEEKRAWGRMGLHTLLVIGATMILIRIPTFLRILKKIIFFQRCAIPTVKCNTLLLYFSGLLSIYKPSQLDVPPFCLLFQAITGFCRVIIKEKIFCFYLFFKPFIFFVKPETVEVLLSSTTLIDKSKEYDLLSPWLGKGLLISSGAKWRSRRKLLTPAFHFSILEEFLPVFQEQSSVLVSKLQALAREPWVDIVPMITGCTLDIICETAMGVSINAQDGHNIEYVRAVQEIGDSFMYRVIRPWLHLDFIFKWTACGKRFTANVRRVQAFTRRVIKNKKLDMEARNKYADVELFPNDSTSHRRKCKAFLELLLEHHLKDPSFTEEDVREEVDTFMVEGHETTAMALSWTLYCLGINPQIQLRVQEELDEIFNDDISRDITREDITRMKYLECVIKETLRLYPPVPFMARECEEPFTVLGHEVPSGSLCLILLTELHRDPDSFPEPEKFMPERFFPENSKGRHPYAYVPFSAGPRNCIGQKFAMMEEKVVLANILRQFHVTSLDPTDKVLITLNLTLKNVNPLRLRFELRNR